MSKLLRTMGSSGARHGRSFERTLSRLGRPRQTYGRIGDPHDQHVDESASAPSLTFRVTRKLRIRKLSRRADANNDNNTNNNNQGNKKKLEVRKGFNSSTLLERLRDTYVRFLDRAASKSGEFGSIPVAKVPRAPPALASAVDSWSMGTAVNSRKGIKLASLDPGFEMTGSEKKYLDHLRRTASSGRI